ncbi:hypothetical protein AWZ03_000608 [Drosophila navojoa]|uniref:SMP-LTD domain-containing protein n=2 Tax=Drosophila navojoa TaxID=7232 RepID=A0A484BZI2_DRONA|nr:hypothetical protein AWZ03_000608 [Drosophila navojoa]
MKIQKHKNEEEEESKTFASGSIEGVSPTSSGPNQISSLSSSVTAAAGGSGGAIDSGAAPVGTWKLIKGKVSQTIEEIKSSKHHQHQQAQQQHSVIPVIVAEPATTVGWTNDPDSDTECVTINTTSVAEEPVALPLSEKQHNSDSDAEVELVDSSSLGSTDVGPAPVAISTERSRLRRGIAHIKSRVKAKQQAAMSKKEQEKGAASSSESVRSNFLRRRNPPEDQTEPGRSNQDASSASEIPVTSGKVKRGILLASKDAEIESGVEMLEDMAPTTSTESNIAAQAGTGTVHFNEDPVIVSRSTLQLPLGIDNRPLQTPLFSAAPSRGRAPGDGTEQSLWSKVSNFAVGNWRDAPSARPLLLLGAIGVVVMFLPMQDFWRGVLVTMLFIVTINYLSSYVSYLFDTLVLGAHPERRPFQIPNYEGMPICEIPAAEEHKTIKTYSGWLNECDSYDPNTFSFSMTRSVYVRLDGTILKLSGTNARIPKRRMWNEKPIDRNKIVFVDHRTYDMRDARIELLPVGLARKRFFNRKYPIQLIVKSGSSGMQTPRTEDDTSDTFPSAMATTPNETIKPLEFANTVMTADLRQLHNARTPDNDLKDITMPCGDEVRLLVFARCDREKEDWYRRFRAASSGRVHESDLHVPMAQFVEESDLQAVAAQQAINLTRAPKSDDVSMISDETGTNTPDAVEETLDVDATPDRGNDGYEGLIMSADAARNPADYVKFMATYQKACSQSTIPVIRPHHHRHGDHRKRSRRSRRQENELWKGIDQSLFLGPSGSVVWANVLMGRCLFSCLNNNELRLKIQDFMQKKLNSIKLPSFMEEVIITNIYLGESPMLFHRISQPMLDERGVWLDADMTYEGFANITVTTKLNLLRVRSKPKASPVNPDVASQDSSADFRGGADDIQADGSQSIFDSDAESTGGSSTETESLASGPTAENPNNAEFFQNSPGNARRIFKIVDRIATSNLFQYASELPYVQRAMENMSANITLRVDLKGLVARGTLNIPPPPSDRIWMCFRGPPRLWISTKPQVGDKSVDWSIVTNVIESKLCEAVNKFLVYPNMVDFSIAFLAKPTYGEEPPA